MNPNDLPKVAIPDLTIDEVKKIDIDEVARLTNKMRRAIVDENR